MRGTFEEPPTGLIPWFSKTKENTYATIASSPVPLQGKPTQAQDVAKSTMELLMHGGEHHEIGDGGWLMMTHKCRGSIVVLPISKSVEPNEEQKEMISGFQQGISASTEISGNR